MTWQPASNGSGKRHWFLYAGDHAPIETRWHLASNGRLVRYATCEAAQRAADRLNRAAVADAILDEVLAAPMAGIDFYSTGYSL